MAALAAVFLFALAPSASARPTSGLSLVNVGSFATPMDVAAPSGETGRLYVVQRADTLAHIAALKYDDPRQWRAIADQNHLTDPLDLQPGMVLDVPPIR